MSIITTRDADLEPDRDFARNADIVRHLAAHPEARQRPPVKSDPGIVRETAAERRVRLSAPLTIPRWARVATTAPPNADPSNAAPSNAAPSNAV